MHIDETAENDEVAESKAAFLESLHSDPLSDSEPTGTARQPSRVPDSQPSPPPRDYPRLTPASKQTRDDQAPAPASQAPIFGRSGSLSAQASDSALPEASQPPPIPTQNPDKLARPSAKQQVKRTPSIAAKKKKRPSDDDGDYGGPSKRKPAVKA